MRNILRYEKRICEIDESNASQHDSSSDVSSGCSYWIHFSFCEVFFFSRKLCFLWSPCFLLIAKSISLDNSGKPTVCFFLKISSSSWIILSISLNELNLSDWLLKRWWWILLWMSTSLVIWNLNITGHYSEILLQVSLK